MMFLFYCIIAILAVISVLVLFAPKKFNVYRSTIIDKPLDEVFEYLKLIKNQDEWSPWKKKDPDMKQEFNGTDGEVGFIAKWEGNKDVGIGEQEITRINKNDSIESRLRFYKPWKSESDAYLKVEKITPDKTNVIWGFSGESKPPTNVFFLFFNMDKAVGKDFEEGLASLKMLLENR
jgi:hypothetical protein